MAEITRRRTGEFLRELFAILLANPEGMRASDALQLLASRFTLTPYEADNDESGGFTKDAETEARTQEKRRITLIGLEKLFDLWDEHYDKLTDRARRRLPLRSIRFLAPGG